VKPIHWGAGARGMLGLGSFSSWLWWELAPVSELRLGQGQSHGCCCGPWGWQSLHSPFLGEGVSVGIGFCLASRCSVLWRSLQRTVGVLGKFLPLL